MRLLALHDSVSAGFGALTTPSTLLFQSPTAGNNGNGRSCLSCGEGGLLRNDAAQHVGLHWLREKRIHSSRLRGRGVLRHRLEGAIDGRSMQRLTTSAPGTRPCPLSSRLQ